MFARSCKHSTCSREVGDLYLLTYKNLPAKGVEFVIARSVTSNHWASTFFARISGLFNNKQSTAKYQEKNAVSQ